MTNSFLVYVYGSWHRLERSIQATIYMVPVWCWFDLVPTHVNFSAGKKEFSAKLEAPIEIALGTDIACQGRGIKSAQQKRPTTLEETSTASRCPYPLAWEWAEHVI